MSEEKKYTVLTVDDEIRITDIVMKLLKSQYRVLSANCAEKALEILKADTVNLILLDVKMPGMTGFEFCEFVKKDEILRTIPVIFVSAYHSSSEIKKGYEVGGNDYLGKPFIKEELFAKIKVHLKFGELAQIESIASVSDL